MILRDWPSFINQNTTIFWFRRDLRLKDNAGLYHALKENKDVQPIFIFDSVILDELDDKEDARVQFIHESLQLLEKDLEESKSSLLILYGDPVELFRRFEGKAVYTNRDYEPYARKRDAEVEKILSKKEIAFKTYKDHLIFEPGEVLKPDGKPYTVFTPFSKQWLSKLNKFYLKAYPTSSYLHHLRQTESLTFPSLEEIGFTPSKIRLPPRVIPKGIINKYDETRDIPSIEGTTRIGIHLRFGTVSIRNVAAIGLNSNAIWLKELIWREFFAMVLYFHPENISRPFRREFENVQWINDESMFEKWKEGKTGYPIVDAGMRQLNATGFMHNRVRMVTASFLTKHLLIDWRWGEAYFASRLLDYDLASNNGGWQWAAGCGCDAAPYFRIFNPLLQAQRFDPKGEYIRKWVPEFGTLNYTQPIVEHKFARDRALRVFQNALRKTE